MCLTPGIPRESSQGRHSARLAVNDVQACGEAPGRCLGPAMPGADLCASRCRHPPTGTYLSQYCGRNSDLVPPPGGSSFFLQRGAQLDPFHVYWVLGGGLCGALFHSTYPVRGSGRGTALHSGSPKLLSVIPQVLHLPNYIYTCPLQAWLCVITWVSN